MDSTVVGALVFAVLFAAGLLGVRVRAALPEDHLSTETKDAVKVGMGLVATMAALVLGLLVASTKGAYGHAKGRGDADGGQDRFPRPGVGKLRF